MISMNGKPVEIGSFPDGTILMRPDEYNTSRITWKYENDREFLALIYLVKHLRYIGFTTLELYMPYIPNARMDRVKNIYNDVFTLKYFTDLLNSLNFDRVYVLDPHSDVSPALIDNVQVITAESRIKEAILRMSEKEGVNTDNMLVYYPDAGSAKRYSDMLQRYYIYGSKKRDWETGQIVGLDIVDNGFNLAGKDILIVDDICSRGGTFYHSAKKLKELGVNKIFLYVTHCENTILEGELLNTGWIEKVYTTDSIFTKNHALIEVLK